MSICEDQHWGLEGAPRFGSRLKEAGRGGQSRKRKPDFQGTQTTESFYLVVTLGGAQG